MANSLKVQLCTAWMACWVCLGKSQPESAIENHYMRTCFFQDQTKVDSFVCDSASKKTTYDVRII